MNRGDPPCNHGGGTAVFMQFMSTAVDSLHGKRERSLITSVLAVCGLSDIHSEHSQNCVTWKTRGEPKNKLAEVALRESVRC